MSTEVQDAYPLSPVQAGMLLHSVHEDHATYVAQSVFVATGDVRVDVLERAWHGVVRRHAALRTAFVWADLDEPVQVVLGDMPSSFQVLEVPEGQSVPDVLLQDRQRGFVLDEGPLARLTLLTRTDEPWRLLFSCHHLILDGWSTGLVLDDLVRIYGTLLGDDAPVLEEPRPFRDYIAWLAEQDFEAAERFWRASMEDFEGVVPIGSRSAAGGTGLGHSSTTVPSETVGRVLRLVRTAGLTLNTVVQGAFALVQSTYTGRDDVCFGITSSGRAADVGGIESMVGMTLSTTPLRVVLDPDEPVTALLGRLQRDQSRARAFEFVSLADVQAWSPGGSGARLVESLLVMQNLADTTPYDGVSLTLEEEGSTSASNFDFTLDAFSSESALTFLARFDLQLFDEPMVAGMLDHLVAVIERLVADPNALVGDLRAAATSRAVRAVPEISPIEVEERRQDEILARRADVDPGAVAVLFEDERLSYAALEARATTVAAVLAARNLRRGDAVVIALDRSHEILSAAYGVLRAGGVIVPLDPGFPSAVVGAILQDCEPRLVITDEHHVVTLAPLSTATVVTSGDLLAAPDLPGPPPQPRTLDDPALLLYTLGGAGTASRTTVTHRVLTRSAASMAQALELATADRVLDLDSRLDRSLGTLMAACTVGAGVVIRSARHLEGPVELRKACASDQVSAMVAPANLFSGLLLPACTGASGPSAGEPTVRVIAVTGDDPIPVAEVDLWAREAGDVRLVRSTGPVESVGTALMVRLVPGSPISHAAVAAGSSGRPAPCHRVDVRDAEGGRVPDLVPGDLHVEGAGRTGLRARRLGDGRIERVGSSDERVTLAGFPVDLVGVRASLLEHPGLADCAVVTDDHVPRRLIAYVVQQTRSDGIEAELRALVRDVLPDHCLPQVFVIVDAIPRTRSGRLLRALLPSVDVHATAGSGADAAPASDIERVLADVWRRTLGVPVGRHQNFFELGGDSITLIRLIGEAAADGLKIGPRQVFENQTVASLAKVATYVEAAGAVLGLAEPAAPGPVPLLPSQAWFFEQDLADVDLWNTEFAFQVRAPEELVRRAIVDVVRRHEAFRLRFSRGADGWEQWLMSESELDADMVDYLDLSHLAEPGRRRAMRDAAWACHRRLSIEKGRTARFVQFHLSDQEPDVLFVVIHHLVLDGVSASVLHDELATALTQVVRGDPVQLPPARTSYVDWAQRLRDHALSAAREELDYWRGLNAGAPIEVPPTLAPIAEMELHSLSVDDTARLLAASQAARVPVQDVLLAALVRSLDGWAGGGPALVNLEGHGREDLFAEVDASRIVGWLASEFPIVLGSDRTLDAASALALVGRQLRSVPHHGIGYGLLRHLSAPEVRDQMRALPQGRFGFGYLGQVDAVPATPTTGPDVPVLEGLSVAAVVGDEETDESRYRSSGHADDGVGIGVWIADGTLTARFTYAGGMGAHALASAAADRYLEALRHMITHGLESR